MSEKQETAEMTVAQERETDQEFLEQILDLLLEETGRCLREHQAGVSDSQGAFAELFLSGHINQINQQHHSGVERLDKLQRRLEEIKGSLDRGETNELDFDLLIKLLGMLERKYKRGYQSSIDRLLEIKG